MNPLVLQYTQQLTQNGSTNLNVWTKTVKFPEENMENYYDIWLGQKHKQQKEKKETDSSKLKLCLKGHYNKNENTFHRMGEIKCKL